MLILCLDSSSSELRVAIFGDGRLLAEECGDGRGNHSEQIIARLDGVLTKSGHIPAHLELLAVNLGPGSFTGLRIGLAAMAGISLAAGIPLIGFNAFEIAAEDLRLFEGEYSLLIPCRGREFYAAHYHATNQKTQLSGNPAVIRADSYAGLLPDTVLVGSGAEAFYAGLPSALRQKCRVGNHGSGIPSLKSLAALAMLKAGSIKQDSLTIPDLFYLAPSQAEINYARNRADYRSDDGR